MNATNNIAEGESRQVFENSMSRIVQAESGVAAITGQSSLTISRRVVDEILAAADTYAQRVVLEGRISDMEKCLVACQTRHPMESIDYLENYLDDLKAQLERLKESRE